MYAGLKCLAAATCKRALTSDFKLPVKSEKRKKNWNK